MRIIHGFRCAILVIGLSALSLASPIIVEAATSSVDSRWRQPELCGVNSLYIIGKLTDKVNDYGAILAKVKVTPKLGSSLQDMATASSGLDMPMVARKVSVKDLISVPTPFIAHLDFLDAAMGGHFVVVLYVDPNGSVECVDGTDGTRMSLSPQFLDKRFTGYVLSPASSGFASGRGLLVGLGIALAVTAFLYRSNSSPAPAPVSEAGK